MASTGLRKVILRCKAEEVTRDPDQKELSCDSWQWEPLKVSKQGDDVIKFPY